MKSIVEIEELKGKRVLVRVDWSVPMDEGRITNDYQIKVSLPTIKYLQEAGAHVILVTHLESVSDDIEVLKPFVSGGVEMLGNLREDPGEENNLPEFAQELASKADIFVNEAFPVSHREHASIVGVPQFLPSFVGFQFKKEVQELSKAFNPPRPFFLILGGAKFETKIPLVEKFLDIADSVFIGGAMAKTAYEKSFAKNPKLIFPVGDLSALDANDETLAFLDEKIQNSEFIIWNGPLGNYEKGFKRGTLELAKTLTESGKQVIVGGGDTLAVIDELNILDKFSFVSTGGGAMLEFLAKGTLPGIEVLK